VARAQPNVPLSWFRLDIMAQNTIFVQLHKHFVLEKSQWKLMVFSRLFIDLALVTAGKLRETVIRNFLP